MFRERGGSSTLARHAFNELVSFVAAWAILIDYMIVIALAAISVPHYLTPISASFGEGAAELITAGVVIAAVAAINIVGFSGVRRQMLLTAIAIGGVLLLVAVVLVGALTSFDADALTSQLDLFTSPTLEDVLYAGVIATVAYAGIEAASDLVPDLEFEPIDLRRLVAAGVAIVPILYTGVAAISVMAVPVVATPDGPMTALATTYLEEPILGVVTSYDPTWVADVDARRGGRGGAARAGLGGEHVDARAIAAQLHARDEPADPELARQAGEALDDPARRDPRRGGDLVRARDPRGRAVPGRAVRVRGHDRVRDRARLARAAAVHRSGARAAVQACPSTSRWRGADVPLPSLAAGVLTDRGLDHGPALPRRRALHRRRLDAVRPGRLRRLPRRGGGDLADEASDRAGQRAGEGRGGARSTAGSWCRCSGRRSTTTSSAPPGGSRRRPTRPGARRPHLEVVYVLEVPLTVPLDAPPFGGADGGRQPGARACPGGRGGVRHGRGRHLGRAGARTAARGSCRRPASATSS